MSDIFLLYPQHSDSQTCPFCRCEIKGREAVSISQAQERPAEVRTAADDSGDNCHQEAAEWKLGPVSRDRQDLEPLFPESEGGGLILESCI